MKVDRIMFRSIVFVLVTLTCISATAGPLQDAAEKGELDTIIKLHKQGADLNNRDDYNMTALHFSVFGPHMSVVDYLLKNNVDLNIQNKSGYTALALAVDDGHIDVAKKLVEHGADININVDSKNKFTTLKGKELHRINRSTALSIAWHKKDMETVRWLISLGANVNVEFAPSTPGIKGSGTTLFHKVVRSNNYDMVKLFLEKGADVNAKEHIYDPIYKRSAYIGPVQMTDSAEIKQLLHSYGAK